MEKAPFEKLIVLLTQRKAILEKEMEVNRDKTALIEKIREYAREIFSDEEYNKIFENFDLF